LSRYVVQTSAEDLECWTIYETGTRAGAWFNGCFMLKQEKESYRVRHSVKAAI